MVGSRTRQPAAQGLGATFALLLVAGFVGVGTAVVGPLATLPIVGSALVALVATRPEYGIALFLSTFLMTYPKALQGSGFLTPNNVLGGLFLLLLTYKLYREEDWWFLRSREIQLLAFISLAYYLSGRLNAPDATKMGLLGLGAGQTESLRTFISRVAFVVFFINFIRTPEHVRMIFVLALAFMVVSAFTGMQGALTGGGLYGGRAAAAPGVIQAAYNPNRLAMFSILAMAGLWYLMQSLRVPGFRVFIIPTLIGLALTVLLTASRSGLLGLAVAVGAIVVDQRARIGTLVNFVLAGVLLIVFMLPFVPERTLERITNLPGTEAAQVGEGAGSLERRQYTWEVAVELVRESPFLGVGIGNWDVARFFKDPTRSTAAPHSSYLLALVEGGLFCLLGFLGLLWCTWRNFREVEAYVVDPSFPLRDLSWIVKSCKISFVVLIFFSLFADLWQMVILFWLVGLGVVMRRLVEQTALQEALAA